MKNPLTILTLVGLIVLTFSFSGIKILANGSPDNYFNQNWRSGFSKHPWLRQLLALQSYGDARADYLGDGSSKILIEVDSMSGLRMTHEALDLLSKRIQSVTGKETTYVISDISIPYSEVISKDELDAFSGFYRDFDEGAASSVHLLYLSKDSESKTQIGKTFQEYGIVLYGDSLRDFTKGFPKTLSNYEASTALHEFGHLLGLEHNGQKKCLMTENAEVANFPKKNPDLVLTDFCEYEKELISE